MLWFLQAWSAQGTAGMAVGESTSRWMDTHRIIYAYGFCFCNCPSTSGRCISVLAALELPATATAVAVAAYVFGSEPLAINLKIALEVA